MSGDNVSCSFCNKHRDDVSKMVAGERAIICNECIDLCSAIVYGGREGVPDDPPGGEAIRLRCIEIVADSMGKTAQWPLVVSSAREVADFVFHGVVWRASRTNAASSEAAPPERAAQ